jgi:hypothetical protein
VDEVEYGLEPHRLVHLLTHLRRPQAHAQVFVTTHSPTALLHLEAKELTIARSSDGITTLKRLDDPTELQRLLRGWPEAFLARHIVVAEGKAEYGISLHLMETWDRHRAELQKPPSSEHLATVGMAIAEKLDEIPSLAGTRARCEGKVT